MPKHSRNSTDFAMRESRPPAFRPRRSTERLGYEVFGELKDVPPGHRSYYVKKDLTGDALGAKNSGG
jgi:hypothetical protein